MTNEQNNKRIAKNTLMLYFRMFITMGISIYTSRVVLDILGVDDFGIYSIVGGVVAMFTFLNATMSGATSRFLTYEMGRGDIEKLKKTFSTSLTIHIIIAIIILIVAETVGLWILNTKLVIADNRMFAAKVVYQLSVISTIITITQVPYNASILAHEKMNVFAYVEVLNVSLKLGIVYLLSIGSFDKLILYGILVMLISFSIAMVYNVYCIKKFKECKYHFVWDIDILKPMITFSSLDLYGNMSASLSQQGTNIILNMFFGTVINAAGGIATQVQGAISLFSNNINMAFRPQIIKNYASGNYQYMETLICNSAKYGCLLLMAISFPLILEMDFIMHLWLKEVPQYAIDFSQVLLITNIFYAFNGVLNTGIHATGKITMLSFISGSMYTLILPVIYLILKIGYSPIYAYLIRMILMIVIIVNALFFLKHNIPVFSVLNFIKKSILPNLFILLICSIIPIIIINEMKVGWLRFIFILFVSTLSFSIATYFIGIDKLMRNRINQYITIKFHKLI